jgi:hypothetical protein
MQMQPSDKGIEIMIDKIVAKLKVKLFDFNPDIVDDNLIKICNFISTYAPRTQFCMGGISDAPERTCKNISRGIMYHSQHKEHAIIGIKNAFKNLIQQLPRQRNNNIDTVDITTLDIIDKYLDKFPDYDPLIKGCSGLSAEQIEAFRKYTPEQLKVIFGN